MCDKMENRHFLEQAIALCDQKEYSSAKRLLDEYLKSFSDDARANLTMVRILTEDYSKMNVEENFDYYFQKALISLPEKEKKVAIKDYNDYVSLCERKSQNTFESEKNSSFAGNFISFFVAFCLVSGIGFSIANQYLVGIILIVLSIVVGLVFYFIRMMKK